jgi:hypothetical protein
MHAPFSATYSTYLPASGLNCSRDASPSDNEFLTYTMVCGEVFNTHTTNFYFASVCITAASVEVVNRLEGRWKKLG